MANEYATKTWAEEKIAEAKQMNIVTLPIADHSVDPGMEASTVLFDTEINSPLVMTTLKLIASVTAVHYNVQIKDGNGNILYDQRYLSGNLSDSYIYSMKYVGSLILVVKNLSTDTAIVMGGSLDFIGGN